jgi:hypothetical protein
MRSKKVSHLVWSQHKCSKCGKVFLAAPEHIYRDKNKSKWYCTWTCFNHKNDKQERVKL